MAERPLVSEVEPELAAMVIRGLRAAGEEALAEQVDRLRYRAACGCDSDTCRSFYTAPKPDRAYGPGHRCILLETVDRYMIVIDVVESDIVFVEFI
jgi:hypothetical protein